MSKPKLTREALDAVAVAAGCRVKTFADDLDPESRAVFYDAVNMTAQELSAPALVQLLADQGFEDAPTEVQIKNHRRRERACKCPR